MRELCFFLTLFHILTILPCKWYQVIVQPLYIPKKLVYIVDMVSYKVVFHWKWKPVSRNDHKGVVCFLYQREGQWVLRRCKRNCFCTFHPLILRMEITLLCRMIDDLNLSLKWQRKFYLLSCYWHLCTMFALGRQCTCYVQIQFEWPQNFNGLICLHQSGWNRLISSVDLLFHRLLAWNFWKSV